MGFLIQGTDKLLTRELLSNIPQCCKDILKVPSDADSEGNSRKRLNLINVLQTHNSDFCLFKTSIF